MTGQRVVVKGKTLDEIATKVRDDYGPRARIVEAQRVTSGGLGIAGLFQKRYVEATVELPERGRRAARSPVDGHRGTPTEPPPAQQAFSPSPAQRVGLAALLADADEADEGFDAVLSGAQDATGPGAPTGSAGTTPPPSASARLAPAPALSTRSDAFAELMDDLAFNGVAPEPVASAPAAAPASAPGPAAPASGAGAAGAGAGAAGAGRGVPAGATPSDPAAPALLDGPGDLVVVIGERPDVVATAQAIADGSTGTRPAVRVAGAAANGRFVAVDDRRAALEARAAGVELDRATIVAVGWDAAAPALVPEIVAALAADQIWIAVDAGRKHADTERWLAAVTATVAADGLAAHGLRGTSTPDTVLALGLPVGWRDA
ncbi:hypothetical protein AX769_05610 [Frondihabitans sp. PAMC 28766]|uniref:hypothetical protein n=1 Tax=Frondihabitans sp. PAMC 28766 TaxID=1795630 RepID=UPI00078B6307|nr:hypothetical protein [Frondihabitans sp. PAMC 28766]AMM19718.1 hypothetical protein AX769_05610 [Frondihabitans sp. PAMC 28766]